MLVRLALSVLRARAAWIAAYLVIVPAAALYGAGVLSELKPGGFRDPEAESTIVDEKVRDFIAGDVVVLYASQKPGITVDDVEAWTAILPALTAAEQDPGVSRVVSFYSTGAPGLLSPDRTRTMALVTLKGNDIKKVETAQRLRPLLQADGFTVELGGYAEVFQGITGTVERDLRRAELLALPITLLLLLLLFRSVVSACLPVLLGGAAIALTLAILRALSAVTEVTIFAANVASILGLGLAIDYALFVLMRYREELPKVGERRAVMRAMATAGRAVAFSGLTVAVSLCGLFVFPHAFLRSIAVGGICVTLATVLLSTTLLPALLVVIGPRIDALRLPFGMPLPDETNDGGLWHTIGVVVMKRPLLVATAVVAGLLVAALPFARLEPTVSDARALPVTHESRRVSEAVERDLGAHRTTPHEVLVSWPDGTLDETRLRALLALRDRVQSVDGIERVDSAFSLAPDLDARGEGAEGGATVEATDRAIRMLLGSDESTRAARALFLNGGAARFSAVSRFVADDDAAVAQVHTLRALEPPPGATLQVGGQSAWVADVRDSLKTRTPAMVAFIGVAMIVVLFALFGSVVLPLKAIAMNLLSITASFGAIVWIFQDGRFTSFLRYEPLGTTESSVPVLMFAIVFGLSMDYEVLLLSRVREEYVACNDNTRAVALGLARTGRLITSAALLLVVVVSCFATSEMMLVKTLAVGIALAVFLDATVVRSLLVPATMRLLGRYNWWAPSPLRRLWERLLGSS